MRPEEIIEGIKSRIRDVHEQLLRSYMDLITVRDEVEALPTTYPVRTPLSDDKLWEIWNADVDDNSPERFNEFLHAARLIEKTHGIGRPTARGRG